MMCHFLSGHDVINSLRLTDRQLNALRNITNMQKRRKKARAMVVGALRVNKLKCSDHEIATAAIMLAESL